MRKILLFISFIAVANSFAQNKAYSDRTTTDKFRLQTIYNTNDYTVVFFKGYASNDFSGTLHSPQGKSPYQLKAKNGNTYNLIKQAGWKGGEAGGFGYSTIYGGTDFGFKLYFEKVYDLEQINSITEKNCSDSNCWNFYDIVVYPQTVDPHDKAVKIENVEVSAAYDVYKNNKKGVELTVSLNAIGLKGENLAVTVKVKNKESNQFEVPNSLLKLDNHFDYYRFVASYDNSKLTDAKLFIPFNELVLGKGKNNLTFDIDVVLDDTKRTIVKHIYSSGWYLTR